MKEKKKLSLKKLKGLQHYPPALASEYLERVRGLIYKPDTLRAIKRRKGKAASAELQLVNNTLWTRPELDAIEPTAWTERVEPETEDDPEAEGEGIPLPFMLCKEGDEASLPSSLVLSSQVGEGVDNQSPSGDTWAKHYPVLAMAG